MTGISICEFYKNPVDVKTVEEALDVRIGNLKPEEIFASLPDSAFDIF